MSDTSNAPAAAALVVFDEDELAEDEEGLPMEKAVTDTPPW
jgi:hypothetical protein